MKTKLNQILFIAVIFLSITVFLYSYNNKMAPPEPQNLTYLANEIKQANPKMENRLYQLIKIYFEQGIEKAEEYAHQRGIMIQDGAIRVVTEAIIKRNLPEEINRKNISDVYDIESLNYLISEQIKTLGGSIETSYSNMIQCIIPIERLEDISSLSYVKYLRLPIEPIPLVISEGVKTTGADQWHNVSPYRTDETVKVCILDAGFKGYRSLLGSELPSSVIVRSFRSDYDIEAFEHGTACAEIVHDMAPNAELYLVNFSTDVEHHNAVEWISNQGIDIISYSIGWENAGAGNGTGPICEDVKNADNSGIIWVSAAGNEAEGHWEGNFKDSDNDRWNNFSGDDEILIFYVNAYTPVSAFLNWNDWGYWNGYNYDGSNKDFDLYLYFWNGYEWKLVDKSRNSQTGFQWPVESINGCYSTVSSWWGVAVRKHDANKSVKLELFIKGASEQIEYNIKNGSLTIPADSLYAISVGATGWSDDSLHYYSSRGPTTDNRIKPDFSAPSGVSGITYGSYGFYGTSASAPHLAGAFALLKEKLPFTFNQIKSIIEQRAKDLGYSGKDNMYGFGRLNLLK